jgi:hypothetical protein
MMNRGLIYRLLLVGFSIIFLVLQMYEAQLALVAILIADNVRTKGQ